VTFTLRTERLTHQQRRNIVLSDVSIDFSEGHVALLGPNGAGKSTLFALLSTSMRPHSGDIRANGLSVRTGAGREEIRAQVGFQVQHARMSGPLRVREAVAYAAWLKRVPKTSVDDRVEAVLAQTNLLHLADRPSAKISGGERKRVAIAQALVSQPAVIMLDEPTASLDPKERAEILNVLRSIRSGTRIVMSTHDTRDLPGVADRVILLNHGKTVFDGSIGTFAAGPTSESLEEAYRSRLSEEPRA